MTTEQQTSSGVYYVTLANGTILTVNMSQSGQNSCTLNPAKDPLDSSFASERAATKAAKHVVKNTSHRTVTVMQDLFTVTTQTCEPEVLSTHEIKLAAERAAAEKAKAAAEREAKRKAMKKKKGGSS